MMLRYVAKAIKVPLILGISAGVAAGAEPPAADGNTANESSPSIYRVDLLDGAIIGVTAGGSLWAYAKSDSLIHPRCPCDPGEVSSFDRGAIRNSNDFLDRTSDVSVGAAVLFPVILDWLDVGFSKSFAEDMAVYAESLSVNGGLVTLAKYTVQRPLPRTYAGDPALVNSPHGYRSFYSGHTSVAFSALSTAAMTHSLRHEEKTWPWILTAIVGTSIAMERVAAGRHFYSDVIVGAVAGTAVGVSIPLLHRRAGHRQTLAFMPVEDGAVFLWKTGF